MWPLQEPIPPSFKVMPCRILSAPRSPVLFWIGPYRRLGYIQNILSSNAIIKVDMEARQGRRQRYGISLIMSLLQTQDIDLLELEGSVLAIGMSLRGRWDKRISHTPKVALLDRPSSETVSC